MDYDVVRGKGDFVFFLHGWGGDKNAFKLANGHLENNLVFVSMPGFGESAPPERAYSIFDYAREVKELIVSLAKGKKSTIVCHSFGARVASIIASECPKLIKSLVIVDGAGLRPRFSLKKFIAKKKYKRLKRLVRLGKRDESKLDGYGSADYKALSGVMKETFVKVVNESLCAFYKKIRVPTLILWGEKDKETPLYMAKKMKRLIKGSELFIIKGAGHFSYLERPDIFVSALKCFV